MTGQFDDTPYGRVIQTANATTQITSTRFTRADHCTNSRPGPDFREGLDSVRQKRDPNFPSARK